MLFKRCLLPIIKLLAIIHQNKIIKIELYTSQKKKKKPLIKLYALKMQFHSMYIFSNNEVSLDVKEDFQFISMLYSNLFI